MEQVVCHLQRLHFRLVILFLSVVLTSTKVFAECVPDFKKDYYDICTEKPCFVFIDEKPFVNLDPTMNSIDDTRPFICRKRGIDFKSLRGPFFDIIDKIPMLDSAMCIWGGPECTYNAMVSFVEERSNDHKRKPQLIVGGMLFYVPERVSNVTYHSAPLVQGKIQIIGPRRADQGFRKSFEVITNPFSKWTWAVVIGFLVFLLVIRIWIALLMKHVNGIWQHLLFCFGQYAEKESLDTQDFKDKFYSVSRVWVFTAGIIYSIFFLYFEVGLLLDQQSIELKQNIRNLTDAELGNFYVTGGSAQENIFKSIVDPKNEKKTETWNKKDNYPEIFDTLIEVAKADNNTEAFALSYDQVAKYFLDVNGACNDLLIYETKDFKHEYTSVWYYGKHVKENFRVELNKNISRLRISGDIRKILERETVSELSFECGASISTQIAPYVFNIAVYSVCAPFLLYLAYSLLREWYWEKKELHQARTQNVVNQTI